MKIRCVKTDRENSEARILCVFRVPFGKCVDLNSFLFYLNPFG